MEKTGLLKELHHRVRNNLQLIVSIINMQLRDSGGEAQHAALVDLQARVMSIGAVHRAMFEAEDLGAVDAAELIGEIAAALGTAQGAGLRINATMDTLSISAEAALPVALIAAEAMLGAIAHPADRLDDPAAPSGDLQIRLRRLPGPGPADAFRLEIDAPWPEGRPSSRKALGARLMQALATQLTGDLTIEEDETGRRITLHVSHPAAPGAGLDYAPDSGPNAAPDSGPDSAPAPIPDMRTPPPE
jgi:two-component sensor histidine kinase